MEGDSNLTAEELRNAGASGVYISYYKTAMEMGISTASTNHAEMVVEEGVEYVGGGFHESIWNDEPRYSRGPNPYGADGTNKRILEASGIYETEGMIA